MGEADLLPSVLILNVIKLGKLKTGVTQTISIGEYPRFPIFKLLFLAFVYNSTVNKPPNPAYLVKYLLARLLPGIPEHQGHLTLHFGL